MTIEQLRAGLHAIVARQEAAPDGEADGANEQDHIAADNLLLAFIDDPDVRDAFEAISKWYA